MASTGAVNSPLMSQNERKPTPIAATDAPKSPADRVRQIQEMQQLMEAQSVHEAPAPVQAQAAAQAQQPARVPDGFRANAVNAVQQALAPKTSPAEAAAYAKAQASTRALFGASTDVEVSGNPWKIIPFGDVLPGLFETAKPLAEYEPVVPEKAVKTEQGLLFELGLKEKKGEAPVQKRAVLVDAQGRLAGAECRTPEQAQRLLASAPWLLPASASEPKSSWRVAGSPNGLSLQVTRGRATESVPLNNFARAEVRGGKPVDIVVAQYFLDRFDAAV